MCPEKAELPVGAELAAAVAMGLGYEDDDIAHRAQLPIDQSERTSAGTVEIVYAGTPKFSTNPGAQYEMLDRLGQRPAPAGQVDLCWDVELEKWPTRHYWQSRPHAKWRTASGRTSAKRLPVSCLQSPDRQAHRAVRTPDIGRR